MDDGDRGALKGERVTIVHVPPESAHLYPAALAMVAARPAPQPVPTPPAPLPSAVELQRAARKAAKVEQPKSEDDPTTPRAVRSWARPTDGRRDRELAAARAKRDAGQPLSREERHLLQQDYRRRERLANGP